MDTPKIGVMLPTVDRGAYRGIGNVPAAARHAEELGLESVWAPDQLVAGGGTPVLESVVALATAAASTDRARVGFGVFVLPLRPIAWVAKQIATLQHVTEDRVVLGVGSGGDPHGSASWQAVGVPRRDRGRRTDLALGVVPRLIAGEPVRLDHEPNRPVVTLAPAAPVPTG